MSRLSPERLNELYVGTLELVTTLGYEKLTMDRIAEATKSSKATLYRQWGSKSALVVDALRCVGEHEEEQPDTGSLRGDLRAIAERSGVKGGDADLIAAIMHAIRTDEDLAGAFRAEILDPGRARIRSVIQRAVDRGEVAADRPALEFIEYLFIAPIALHQLFEGDEPSTAFLTHYFESTILPALGID